MAPPSDNPFAPPKASVLEAASDEGEFIPEGRKVESGRGTAWLAEAWKLFLLSPGVWIGIFLIYILMSFALAIIPLGSIVSSMLYPVFTAGLMLGCRDLEQGGKLEVAHLFAGFKKNVGNLILVGLLYLAGMMAIAVVAGICAAIAIPILGLSGGMDKMDSARMLFVLFPVIAVIFLIAMALAMPLIMALWFAPPLVLFHDMPPMDAMKASFAGCMKNIWPFLVYGLVALLLVIVALIPLGLGLLVVSPMIWASIYTAYRDIYIRRD